MRLAAQGERSDLALRRANGVQSAAREELQRQLEAAEVREGHRTREMEVQRARIVSLEMENGRLTSLVSQVTGRVQCFHRRNYRLNGWRSVRCGGQCVASGAAGGATDDVAACNGL